MPNVVVPDQTRNKPPVAVALYDPLNSQPSSSKFVTGRNSTDADGTIVSYLWKKISGPNSFVISNPTNYETEITSLQTGVYEFELTVTDNGGLTGKDTLTISVDLTASNSTIIADAGPDQTLTLPLDSTYLDGSMSRPNGYTAASTVTFKWTTIAGPTQNVLSSPGLFIPGEPRTTVVARRMVPGVYLFTLTLIGLAVPSNIDTVQVTVLDDPQNRNTVTYHRLSWKEGNPAGRGQVTTFVSSSIRPDIFTPSGVSPLELALKADAASPFIIVPFKSNNPYTWDAAPHNAWIMTVPINPLLVGKKSDLRIRFL
jgi:hypothetical protein